MEHRFEFRHFSLNAWRVNGLGQSANPDRPDLHCKSWLFGLLALVMNTVGMKLISHRRFLRRSCSRLMQRRLFWAIVMHSPSSRKWKVFFLNRKGFKRVIYIYIYTRSTKRFAVLVLKWPTLISLQVQHESGSAFRAGTVPAQKARHGIK